MKKAMKALWHGIKAVFTAAVDWVATLFGMNENSKYCRVLRRVVGTTFALVVLLWGVYTIVGGVESIYWSNRHLFQCDDDDDVSFSNRLSDNVVYHRNYFGDKCYLLNADGEKVLEDVLSIAMPREGDSLVWFSNGEKRGYFHLRDGRLAIEPRFERAWIFSEGLAAVQDKMRVKFIDTTGRVVIDKGFSFRERNDGYVFHEGHCAVSDSTGKHMGLIDHDGDWALPPIYDRVRPVENFWILVLGNQEAILNFAMDTLFPLTDARFILYDTVIKATFKDHTVNIYSRDGKLLEANLINDVEQLMYDTREVIYPDSSQDCETYRYYDPYTRKAVATCRCYEAAWGWHGLMSPDGRCLTPPAYKRIEAVDKDLYLCETGHGHKILLDGKGNRVK